VYEVADNEEERNCEIVSNFSDDSDEDEDEEEDENGMQNHWVEDKNTTGYGGYLAWKCARARAHLYQVWVALV